MKFYFYVNLEDVEALNKMVNDRTILLEEFDTLRVFYNKNDRHHRVMFSLSYDDYMRLLDSDKIKFV